VNVFFLYLDIFPNMLDLPSISFIRYFFAAAHRSNLKGGEFRFFCAGVVKIDSEFDLHRASHGFLTHSQHFLKYLGEGEKVEGFKSRIRDFHDTIDVRAQFE
jgi:hypothetical protein